jgi:endonuclease YncB( thermonuclease family)
VPATSTPVGTFKIQVSNSNPLEIPPAGTPDATAMDWADSGATVASAGSGETLYVQHAPAQSRWVRLVYTRTSGSGSATVNAHGKGAH